MWILGALAIAAAVGVLVALIRFIEWYVKTDEVENDD